MSSGTEIRNLRCEYLQNPLGIDASAPRFSWEIQDSRRGVRQTAYRILVASSLDVLMKNSGDVWDSGRMESDHSLNITYMGIKLQSFKQYYWKVCVWINSIEASDETEAWSDHAYWTMGVLSDDEWRAKWITTPDYMNNTPVCVSYMSAITESQFEEKWVQIDLGDLRSFDSVRLHGAVGRRLKSPPGGEIPPGDGFPMRFRIEASASENMNGSFVVVDRTAEDVDNPGTGCLSFEFSRIRARFVRITATKHRELFFTGRFYCLKLSEMEVMCEGKNIAAGCKVQALDSIEDMAEGFGADRLTDGVCSYDAGKILGLKPAPLFRREFNLGKPVKRAIIYATALGNYELYLNGKTVGDQCLAPGYSQYNKRLLYQTYDVTGQLRIGENAMGALLGDGWYRLRYRLDTYGQFRESAQKSFGDEIPRLFMQMEVEYDDGTTETLRSDEYWTCHTDGPYRRISMYDGVIYDASKELKDWKLPGYVNGDWCKAVVCPPGWKVQLTAQQAQPVRRIYELKPVSVKEITEGVVIYDFGQALGGVCRVTLDGPEGTVVKLRHAPAVNPDGTLFLGNLWGIQHSADTYILNGRETLTLEPPFSYHGFQYVEVSGLPSKDCLREITAVMISDDHTPSGYFQSSDPVLNKLWENVCRTYRACMKSALADVADRDERWGWLGDCFTTQLHTLPYMFDVSAYFERRCRDICDDQTDEGFFAPIAPQIDRGWSTGWSDAGVMVPWAAFEFYDDVGIVRNSYEAIKKYINAIHAVSKNYICSAPAFNDWLSAFMSSRPDSTDFKVSAAPDETSEAKAVSRLSDEFFNSCFWHLTTTTARKMAQLLGKHEDEKHFYEMSYEIKKAFICNFIKEDGTVGNGSQSAYALALYSELVPEGLKQKSLHKLVEAIYKYYGGRFSTGTITTIVLLKTLSDNGYGELAYNLAMQEGYPSFRFMVDYGATSIWERFDMHRPGMGFNPEPMNGLIHAGFCSVGEWIFECVGGIRADANNPGFKQFIIKPDFPDKLLWVKSRYHSIKGEAGCEWKRDSEGYTLKITVPANTSAMVFVPSEKIEKISESGMPIFMAAGIEIIDNVNECMIFKLLSGEYNLRVQI